MDLEKFLAERLAQLHAQLGRITAENDDLAGDVLYRDCLSGRRVQHLGSHELGLLRANLDRRTKAVQARLTQLSVGAWTAGDRSLPPQLCLHASSPPVPQLVEESFGLDEEYSDGEAAAPGNDLLEIGGSGMWADVLGTGSEREIFNVSFREFLPKRKGEFETCL